MFFLIIIYDLFMSGCRVVLSFLLLLLSRALPCAGLSYNYLLGTVERPDGRAVRGRFPLQLPKVFARDAPGQKKKHTHTHIEKKDRQRW